MQKTIVITGANGGLGSACMEHFLSKEYNVIGLMRNIDGGNNICLKMGSKNSTSIKSDISDYESVKEAFNVIKEHYKAIDILINNAAVFKTKPFEEFNAKEIDNIIDTNIKGTMYCTLEAMKLMDKGGRIINIGSVSGIHGIKNQAVYSASKHAVNGFADSLGQEDNGILFTTINTGAINTPLWNDNNPYNGDINQALNVKEIVELIDYIVHLPQNVVFKNATMFPESEWH